MKPILLLLTLITTTLIASAQTKIDLPDVSKHIGDSIQLSAQVFGVKYLPETKGAPTFINLGASFPNQLLTVVIWENVRKQMSVEPTEESLKGKTITIIGKLELYKDKAQIVIKEISQFKIIDRDQRDLPLKN